MIREQLSSLDSVNLNLASGTGLVMSIVLALIMFGIALGINGVTLKNVFFKPKSIIVGLVLQWFGLPFVTFLLIMALNSFLTPMVCLGMILVASCPGGNISNFMSSISHGNIELSVSLAAVSTVSSPIITPFNFWFWGNLYLKYSAMSNSLVIPNLTKKIKKPFSIFSLVVFIVMVLGMFIPNWQIFIKYIIFIFVLVLIHNACAFGTGALGATVMKLPARDRRSITIEVGIQNSGLGLTLLLNPAIFKPEIWNNPATGILYGGMLFVTAWWGIWHIISGLALSAYFRSKPLPEEQK